jgi:antitoxin component YwqK of YwqJK toxin-antitoxin module
MEHDSVTCYICFENETIDNPFLKDPKPCRCKGSIMIHKDCLEQVIKSSRNCSICKYKYNLKYLPNRNGLELVVEVDSDGDITEYTINENGAYHGDNIVKKSTGQIITQCRYTNGELDGPFISWYQNGQMESECVCNKNRIEGIYREWYENGVLKEQSIYRNGLRDGLMRYWDQNGILLFSRSFINGEDVMEMEVEETLHLCF